MKSKSSFSVFLVSFIPYIALVVYSFFASIEGVSVGFFGDQTLRYGADGYSIAFILMFLFLWYVFVACLIVQIVILLIEKIRHKTKIHKYVIGMISVYLIGDIYLFFS